MLSARAAVGDWEIIIWTNRLIAAAMTLPIAFFVDAKKSLKTDLIGRDAFIATLAHEIRMHISAIYAGVMIMKRLGKYDEKLLDTLNLRIGALTKAIEYLSDATLLREGIVS